MNLTALKWAQGIEATLSRMLGRKIPFEGRVIHIVLRTAEPARTPGRCSADVVFDATGGQYVQRLTIEEPDSADREDVEELLCRLLLAGCVGTDRLNAKISVPYWLSLGLAQNLHKDLVVTDSERCVEYWAEGRLLPIADYLELFSRPPASKPDAPLPGEDPRCLAKAVSGLFVEWLLSLPDKVECMARIFEKLRDWDGADASWLPKCLGNCDSLPALNDQWDRLILKQRYIVRRPGTATSVAMSELERELTLYPGDITVPLSAGVQSPRPLKTLIARRAEPWVSDFCRGRILNLKRLAIGRSDDFKRVVELYCDFLRALSEVREPGELESILNAADAAFRNLAKALAPSRNGGGAPGQ